MLRLWRANYEYSECSDGKASIFVYLTFIFWGGGG